MIMSVVIRLYFLTQNNHVVPLIKLLCLYLVNSQNSIHYMSVVIRLHFLMQNNHIVLSIELLNNKQENILILYLFGYWGTIIRY